MARMKQLAKSEGVLLFDLDAVAEGRHCQAAAIPSFFHQHPID
jgi:hypothetical protein